MISRTDRGPLADWMRSVDGWLIAAFGALMVFGVVIAFAASPAVAERLGLPSFHFVDRQAALMPPTALALVVTSFLTPRYVRRAALIQYALGLVLIFAALQFGAEVKGSRRWIVGLQPSEFIKPAFIVLTAWALSEAARPGAPRLVARFLAIALLPLTITPLVLEPDFGQTMLISLVWVALVFMAGLHWFWVLGLGAAGAAGGYAAFRFSEHVHERVLQFIDPDTTGHVADMFQIHTAMQCLLSGGWFGRGVGEGIYKRILPDAHTDMVFSVIGEEFGMIACLGLIAFFGLIVMRGLWLASRNADPFCRLAAAGLTLMFGVQSWINIAVNVRAMPAKGMTLPFISYGGSSMLALGIGMGLLVALTRKQAGPDYGAVESEAT
ncbi:MAG: FtsW/RodA/SpoVE family cell cycle protein [Roseiarcus sp.]